MTELDKLDQEAISVREGLHHLAKMLIKSREEASDKRFELELFWMCEENGLQFTPVPRDLADQAEASATAEIEREEMGED